MQRGKLPARALTAIITACCVCEAQALEPVHVAFDAPPECPSRDDFLLQLGVRSRRLRLADPGEPARAFEVTIRLEQERFVGRLRTDGASEAPRREFTASDCDVVVASLALAVALVMDADQPEPSGPPPAAEPGAPEPVLSAPPPAFATEPALAPPRHGGPWRGTGGIQAQLVAGVAPAPLIAPRLFAELLRRSDGAWAPSFRVSVVRAHSGVVEAQRGTAAFTWTTGRAESCAHRFELISALHFSPCAFVDAGALRGEGARVSAPRAETVLWLAPGALVRLDQELFGALVLELQAAAFVPLNRARFYFEPDPIVLETPMVGGELALGTGFRFP
jgi:hypothetical protein